MTDPTYDPTYEMDDGYVSLEGDEYNEWVDSLSKAFPVITDRRFYDLEIKHGLNLHSMCQCLRCVLSGRSSKNMPKRWSM